MDELMKICCLLLLILIKAAVPVFAGTSATLHLRAVVPSNVAITIESTTFASSIDVSKNPKNELLGIVTEMSNSMNGYQVQVSSKHALNASSSVAMMKNGSDDMLPYYLSYDDSPITFSNGSAVVTDTVGRHEGGFAAAKEVKLMGFDLSAPLAPGSYSDTLTFTISAK